MLLLQASVSKAILAAEAGIGPQCEAEMKQADGAGDNVMMNKTIQPCVCFLHSYLHTKMP